MRKSGRDGRTGTRRQSADTISATHAAKGLGALVDRVREHGASFVIERAGVPVARIGPVAGSGCTVADLVHHLRSVRGRDDSFARQVRSGVRRVNAPAVPRDPWAS